MALPRCDTWPHAVKTPIRFGLPYRLNIVAAIVVAVALSLAIEPRLRKPHGGGHA